MARERAPWIKLWGTYAESPTLAGLDGSTRWVGVCLMLLVRTASDTGERTTWAVHPDGRPLSIRDIAGYAHVTTRSATNSLEALARRRFVARREDGAFGLPKFWEYQETPDAKRKREQKVPGKSGGDSGALSGQEDRGQREQQHASHAGRPPATKRDSKPPDPYADATTVVLRALNDARCSVTPGLTPLRKRENIRARLAEGKPVEHLLAVIAFAADECRRDPAKLQWLDAVTPFRPKNWESRLARAQAWQATSKRSGPALDLDSDAIARKRREAEEFDREHRPWTVDESGQWDPSRKAPWPAQPPEDSP